MLKKVTLNVLLVCLLFGYTPEAKPYYLPEMGVGAAAIIFGIPVVAVGAVISGIGYGLYRAFRPYTEKELLEKNSSITKEIEKYQGLIDLIDARSITAFTAALKSQNINNKKHLNKFQKNLKSYSKKLEDNKTGLIEILEYKGKKQETLGVYDIKQAIDNSKSSLLKLNELQDFLEKNKILILEKLAY